MSGLFAGTKWERPVTCEHCGRERAQCTCPRGLDGQVCRPADQPARVRRERRGGGKMVTIVTGLDPKASDVPALLKRWKSEFGTGGTLDGEAIELQGDHRDTLVDRLRAAGYPAKDSGG